jgi:hypothetical protein
MQDEAEDAEVTNETGDDESRGRPLMLTLDERDHLLRRQGEVCRELEALRAEEFCPGDEAPLILEDGLNRELDEIEDALAEDGRCEPGDVG